MKRLLLFIFPLFYTLTSFTQEKTLDYYLPDLEYDATIPTPESFFGFQIGKWHISHDMQVMYMRELARRSPRITLQEYARSYEDRPLILLTITSEKNQQNIEEIRTNHLALSQPDKNQTVNLSRQPLILYQGFSIHGNEPSGGNAATLIAYYLAAAQDSEVINLLENVVILLDPCYNPDGFQRFSSWVNTHKNKNGTGDGLDREYNVNWPRGRTNHYWFDLNRDWLLVQHPESRGRVANFQKWRPNVLTDHHEMGTNSTFFFMPGEPQRTNPFTPMNNQVMTEKIGEYHARALNKIGSLYYSKEGYDDFYYGKGSTYPDAQGSIGILFEQASSRGHQQKSDNGMLTFPFTIRNQVVTALSTQTAALEMKKELLQYQEQFFENALKTADLDPTKAFIFGESNDHARLMAFTQLIRQHDISVYQLTENMEINGCSFKKNKAFIVPLKQPQYHLIKGIFEKLTSFKDSLFYDVSAWTLPLAYNLQYESLTSKQFSNKSLGPPVTDLSLRQGRLLGIAQYAYLMEWDEYYAPQALNALLQRGVLAKVAHASFQIETVMGPKEFKQGTILVPLGNNQTKRPDEVRELIETLPGRYGVNVYGVNTGLTATGIDLGSRNFSTLQQPKILLLVGSGVSSYDAGEIWHLLDQRYDIPIVKMESSRLGSANLSEYNTIIMADGSYKISNGATTKVKAWLANGGTLIAFKRAMHWIKSAELANIEFRPTSPSPSAGSRAYASLSRDRGAQVIGGAIFETKLDLSHPLGYGYSRSRLPIFRRGTLFLEPAKNRYATPLSYTSNPLLSGYISKDNLQTIKKSASIVVSGRGRGRTICFADNPNFRAFWWGTNKLFANAIFFGHTIDSRAIE